MAEPIAEYTVSNFNAVDNQIEQIAQRERVITQKLRLTNLFQVIKFAIIILAAVGLFFILLAIAYRIAFPAEKTIVKETVIGQEAQTLDTVKTAPVSRVWGTPDQPSQQQANTQNDKRNDSPKRENKDSVIGKRSVTTFTSVPSNIIGFGDVVTGWRWDDIDAKSPSNEYCYLERPEVNGLFKIDIASKNPEERKPKNLYTLVNSNEAGLSKTQWNDLLGKCRWSGF